jgi:hypothetical protein
MYNSNLIMAVKVGGKVLREFDGTVALPFGSEYTIFLKNNSSRRASVDVTIDGQDVLDGTSIIINANSTVELQRFIKNGNFENGNAFKFIEKTAKIEEFRGNKAEDGLLTVSYSFEREVPRYSPNILRSQGLDNNGQANLAYYSNSFGSLTDTTSDSTSYTLTTSNTLTVQNASFNDSGITAPGSVVEQKFRPVYGFVSDGKVLTMTLKMVGALDGQAAIVEPVIVKRKVRCTMCGTHCRQTAKFCHECGASVIIV